MTDDRDTTVSRDAVKNRDMDASGKYSDIIGLPHHVSPVHPRMPLKDRAAQFMPFAALTGYADAVKESARLTEQESELTDDAAGSLNAKLSRLNEELNRGVYPEVQAEWFVPDAKKDGGAYRTMNGIVRKIDREKGILYLQTAEEQDGQGITGRPGRRETGNALEAVPLTRLHELREQTRFEHG